jgi:4-coumarate--CoA ligase
LTTILSLLTVYRNDNELPRAYLVLSESAKGKVTETDIQKWLEPRVSKHKRLVGGVVLIDEVPKLASGKIQRKVMREWAARDAKALQSSGQFKERL